MRLLPQLRQGKVVEPKVFIVKGRDRAYYQVRSVAELRDLALGGDVEYALNHYVEMSWTNDSVSLKLQLVPLVIKQDLIVFRAMLALQYNGERLIVDEPLPRVSFSHNDGLLVPPEVLAFLQARRC